MKNKLDPEELKKNILNATIQHPMTLFPTGLAFLGGLGFVLFDATLFSGVAVAGLTVGATSWVYNYFNRKTFFTNKYVKQLQEEARKERESILKKLRKNLKMLLRMRVPNLKKVKQNNV